MDKNTKIYYEGRKLELEDLIDDEYQMEAYYSEKLRDVNKTIEALEKELEKVKNKLKYNIK